VKYYFILLLACYSGIVSAQSSAHPVSIQPANAHPDHIFIITTDGFRWQEVFSGADSAMINDDRLVRDKELIKQLYWDSTAELRRKRLMPFFWNVIARDGQLYGNRSFNNKVNMSNLYKISYPGYNEILTGYADPLLIPNVPLNNRNENILDFLNDQPQYNGKVVAFSSWNIFPFIFNEKRSNVPLNSGYQKLNDKQDATNGVINRLQDEVVHKSNTRDDLLTFASAKEYISKNHPSVVFIGFGETDESAHAGRYDLYLQNASAVDRMIEELWYFVQTDPEYKGRTAFIITTDHGRGKEATTWHTHGPFSKGSGDTWLACIGTGIQPMGEMKQEEQIYGKQLAATIGQLMGERFETNVMVGKAISLPPVSVSIDADINSVVTDTEK